jgi:protein-disulfide isomerase
VRNEFHRNVSRVSLTLVAAIVSQCLSSTVRAEGISEGQANTLIQQNTEVLDELKQIHKLLEQQLAVPPRAQAAAVPPVDEKVRMRVASGGFEVGSANAPLTLVEYTDYQCAFCRQFQTATYEEIKKNYIDTGKLRFVTRDFPLDMHDNAPRAAIAARCAADQGKFWELRQVMIINANQLQMSNLLTYAADLKLDVNKFSACVTSKKYTAYVAKDLAEGRAAGVTGTPTFVLGRMADGSIDGVRIVGALPYATFDAKFQSLMAQAPAK